MHDNYILLTFDVEDWFQVENLRFWNPPSTWSERELRVEKSTHRILDLLDSFSPSILSSETDSAQPTTLSFRNSCHSSLLSRSSPFSPSVCATFFVLGWIAKRCPHLVREIHARGHEVASHGDSHLLCTDMGQDDLDQDLVRSKARLEDLVGQPIKGYRAPSFSVSEAILERIHKAGYVYDSSYNSFVLHPRYGQMNLPEAETEHSIAVPILEDFFELPISNFRLGKKVIPWGGGGYFRLIPAPMFTWGVRKIVHTDGAYVLYLHPWEFDPDQPRVKEVSWQYGFRHYVNLKKTGAKLERLIQRMSDCCFVTCSEYLGL